LADPAPRSLRESRREGELAQRRADAIAGASTVFAAKGFHEAQMTEIAAAAELSRASLYAIFTGKEELYQEVIRTTAQSIRAVVEERMEALEDPRDRLLCVIDSLFSCYEENQDLLQIYTRATNGLPWRIRRAMGDEPLGIFWDFVESVIGLARQAGHAGYLEGLDPEAFTLSLVGAINTTAARWIENRPDRPLSEAAPGVRSIFERILSRPAQPGQ